MTYSIRNHDSFDLATLEQKSFDEAAWKELQSLSDKQIELKRSLILSLKSIQEITPKDGDMLALLHEKFYSHDCSFVICELEPKLKLDLETMHAVLAIAPTQAEAIDIVSMEVIERELLNGEDL